MSYAYIATNASAALEACGREFFDNGLTIFTNDAARDREGGRIPIPEAINVVSRPYIGETTRKQIISDTLKWLLKLF